MKVDGHNHILNFRFCRIESKRSHTIEQLHRTDESLISRIKESKRLSQICVEANKKLKSNSNISLPSARLFTYYNRFVKKTVRLRSFERARPINTACIQIIHERYLYCLQACIRYFSNFNGPHTTYIAYC